MKKLNIVLAAIISIGIAKLVLAEDIRNVPGSGNTTSIPADYGGVDIATNSFFIGLTTVPTENGAMGIGYRGFNASTTTVNGIWAQNRWTIYGVNWSTGQCATGSNAVGGYSGDFVSIQVSSAMAAQAREVTRIYNTVQVGTSPVCGGFSYLRWPARVYGQLFFGVNASVSGGGTTSNPYNRADLLYYLENK